MAKRIVEGLWDCPYCQTKAIGGLTKHCPRCGHPQDAGTRFYMGQKKKYLDDELAAQYGQGADWVCAYCGSLNRTFFRYCAGCGAPKDESKEDYFSAKAGNDSASSAARPPDAQPSPARRPQAQAARASSPQAKPSLLRGKRGRLFLILGAALLAVLLIVFWPRTYTAEVTAMGWAREIDIEAWRTVQESDWEVPEGGRIYDRKSEIHHYVQVLDHYETRSREVSEQVYDGEDYYTTYSDNGDGTFTEVTHSSPRYRTEYHTEYYEDPVYRSDPVFATKYYYEIEKWVPEREERSSGADSEPYWPKYTLAENERVGPTWEAYTMGLAVKDRRYSVGLPLEKWETFHAGDTVEVTVVAGDVTKVNGEPVK